MRKLISVFCATVVFTVVCALGLVAMTPVAEARDVGELGGNGGVVFRAPCRTNDVLIGLNMRSGKALDAVAAICIPTNPQRTEWSGEAYEAAKDDGSYYGGGGGDYQKIACNGNYAVTHLHVFIDGNGAVNHVIITCRRLGGCSSMNTSPRPKSTASPLPTEEFNVTTTANMARDFMEDTAVSSTNWG